MQKLKDDLKKTAKVTAVFETNVVAKKEEPVAQKTPEKKKIAKQNTTVKRGKTNVVFSMTQNNEEYTITNRQLQTGMLTKAKRFVRGKYENHKGVYNFAFVLLNVLVVFGILLYQQNTLGVMSVSDFFSIENKRWSFFGYAVLVFVLIMLCEALRTFIFISKSSKRARPLLSYKSAVRAKYYDALVPIMGGKPFEMFYLYKNGLKPSVATSVPISKYLFSVIATIILSTVVIVSKWSFLQETNKVILGIGIVMLLVNLLLTTLMILFSVSKKIAPKMLYQCYLGLEKIHILKNHKQTFYNSMRFILEYQKSVEYYLKSKPIALLSLLLSLSISLLYAVLPVLVYGIFVESVSGQILLEMMFHYYILLIAINYVPLPSGTGVTEFAFTALFSAYFVDGTLFWALLLWRFFSYYAFILQGLFVLVIDTIVNAIKCKKGQSKEPSTTSENL